MAAIRIRSTLTVAFTQFGVEGLGLLRNVLLARALGPSEMGLVAALTLTLSLVEMICDFGPDRLLVQAEDGDAPQFQSTAHSVLALRGLLTAGLLALLAFPLAQWIGRPESCWAIAALGLVPAIRGFQHLDAKRIQRQQKFQPSLIIELSAAFVATTAVAVATRWLPRGEVLVWVSLLQAMTLVIASRGVAERPYQLGWNRELLRRLFVFGWPLALNSLIMFGAFQGDRLVVMLSATPAELGRYAVAFQLTMVPALLISRVASTAWLPGLARSQSDPMAYYLRMSECTAWLGLVGQLFSLGILALGNRLIGLLYGPDYPLPVAVMAWLGIMQGWRILRAGPSLFAMSRADTWNPLASNLLRLLGIAAAATAGLFGAGLELVAICGCAGEVLAMVGAIVLLRRRHHLEVCPLVSSSLLFAGSVAAGSLACSVDQTLSLRLISLAGVVFCLGMTIRQLVRLRFAPGPRSRVIPTGL